MREIVFDTETTGLDPYQGDRLVEIGCVELINGFPTGQSFHRYLNPERDMPEGAFKVHGLSIEFLKDKPLFADVCDEFLAFIGDAPLIAHNAMFDLGFINAELERCKKAPRPARPADRHADAGAAALSGRAEQARRSVRALFHRSSRRTKHGALLDAELLAEVYVELTGKRQARLGLTDMTVGVTQHIAIIVRTRPAPLVPRVTDAERAAHRAFVATLGDKAIWKDYLSVLKRRP